ncbi:MAG: pyruvate ferredoxin oxidoreductase [Candidatus Moranbacteria bacterium RIFCSPHIGHO2_02_FULL_40_12b]|nr:MAG: pyruvate ferredoxin oxidoreductase [Candidatus Moranbacteria bacterium RIFCSPHIGHO2_02_FULL_40_12b]OGI24071.1 MAG: pyruvate ferredoxin oxidoreductase [Candidatus Moranbacteria bacterium RIFCSPHIGHO2_12_FULL_40_10]
MNKKLTQKFAPGHSTCAGCGIPAIVRTVLDATNDPVVVVNGTGCLEVTSTLYPYTSWKVPYIHNAFENAAATAAGIDAAQKVLEKKGRGGKKAKIIAFAGDGGTYDIGLQSLSGALERGHNFLYVCYDNQGYMNTGGQRSSASPYGASTETTPSSGKDIGNELYRKDLMQIVEAHHIKYLAQANVAYIEDLKMKAKKGLETEGPSFLLVLQPCTNLWKYPTSLYVHYGKSATETNFWPLYEISAKGGSASGGENVKYKINYTPKERKPIEEFLKGQGRFKHLFKPHNKKVIEKMQKMVDEKWEELIKRSKN